MSYKTPDRYHIAHFWWWWKTGCEHRQKSVRVWRTNLIWDEVQRSTEMRTIIKNNSVIFIARNADKSTDHNELNQNSYQHKNTRQEKLNDSGNRVDRHGKWTRCHIYYTRGLQWRWVSSKSTSQDDQDDDAKARWTQQGEAWQMDSVSRLLKPLI